MGLFDFLTGTKTDKTRQTIGESSDSKVKESQMRGTTTAGTTERGVTQAQQVELLDTESRNILTELLGTISAGGLATPQAFESGLLETLAGRAGAADANLAASREAIIGRARQTGERNLGQQFQQLSGTAGSSLNTLVQQLQGEGRVDLETSLGALQAQLERADRAMGSQELAQALELSGKVTGGRADVATQIADVLKGATQTGRTETQDVTNQLTQVLETLEALKSGKTYTTKDASGKTKSGSSIIDVLNALSGFSR